MFSSSNLLLRLSHDFNSNSEGLIECLEKSETAVRSELLLGHELFSNLGPVSRILADGIGRAARNSTPQELSILLQENSDSLESSSQFLARMLTLSKEWESSWKSSKLNGTKESQLSNLNDTKAVTTSLWRIFKAFLFSQTMIFDSLTEAIVDMCPSPTLSLPISSISTQLSSSETELQTKWNVKTTSNLSLEYLEMISQVLKIYSSMFWVTSSFGISPMGGPAGFDTYRKVFYSSLDILGRDELRCTQVVEELAFRHSDRTGDADQIDLKKYPNLGMDGDGITYFLDLVEQLIVVLSDEIIKELILPLCER